MISSNYSSTATGWIAFAAGFTGILGLIFLILLFAIGQPFGTLNDICIGLTAVLSAALAWLLYPVLHEQASLLSQAALIAALLGALVVVAGSTLVISGVKGWFLAGLYMAAGNGLLGLWLIALNTSAFKDGWWSSNLSILGLVSGVIMAVGLAAIPGIVRGIDSTESASWVVNMGQAGALGYLVLTPVWSILLGRFLPRA